MWSFFPVHPLLHLTVYIWVPVHRFVNILSAEELCTYVGLLSVIYSDLLRHVSVGQAQSTVVTPITSGFKNQNRLSGIFQK